MIPFQVDDTKCRVSQLYWAKFGGFFGPVFQ